MSKSKGPYFIGQFLGAVEPLPITRIIQPSANARTVCRTQDALIAMPPLEEPLPCLKDFGWYWTETEEIRFLADELYRRKIEFNVWSTPQMRAIEWLLDCSTLPVPAEFDLAMHGVFCRIFSLRLMTENEALEADLIAALEAISAARKFQKEAYDKLATICPEVLSLLQFGPKSMSLSTDQINSVAQAMGQQLGVMTGALEAEIQHRRKVSERLVGPDANKSRGAKRKWLSDFSTLLAADIFLTAGFPRERILKGGKSFRTFLEYFCEDVPFASSADKTALARKFWDGEGGAIFAPVENWLSHLRGKYQRAV